MFYFHPHPIYLSSLSLFCVPRFSGSCLGLQADSRQNRGFICLAEHKACIVISMISKKKNIRQTLCTKLICYVSFSSLYRSPVVQTWSTGMHKESQRNILLLRVRSCSFKAQETWRDLINVSCKCSLCAAKTFLNVYRNLVLLGLLTNGSSAVNGCRQNKSSNS